MRDLLELARQKQFLECLDITRSDFEFKYLRSLRRAFRQEADTLFKDHSVLRRFTFTQASNPENDYDFFVNRLDYEINGVNTKNIDDSHELYQALKDINEFVDVFDDGELLRLFGDHASVTVTEHNIEISFYDVEV